MIGYQGSPSSTAVILFRQKKHGDKPVMGEREKTNASSLGPIE